MTCVILLMQAAEQLREEDAHEAGVYGVLGGNLGTALPLCASWHDRLWVHCRGWLEAAVDAALPTRDPTGEVTYSLPHSNYVATMSTTEKKFQGEWSLIDAVPAIMRLM